MCSVLYSVLWEASKCSVHPRQRLGPYSLQGGDAASTMESSPARHPQVAGGAGNSSDMQF